MDESGRPSDERSPAGMGRASVEPEILIGPVEPDDDAQRGHRAAAFRPNHVARPSRSLAPSGKGVGKLGVDRD